MTFDTGTEPKTVVKLTFAAPKDYVIMNMKESNACLRERLQKMPVIVIRDKEWLEARPVNSKAAFLKRLSEEAPEDESIWEQLKHLPKSSISFFEECALRSNIQSTP
ncbi:hypothetical protein BTUL_0190g00110 [Botrytis tulipae]|uniref:Uncharacterized protein n=1 Tax=Botrytis tulipae TaxID=87230 RepID=A0A4Z1EI90_9HELO|nr:hypothetical protein BTUL_0190g00110 [Botrytis tulipae]